MFFALLFVVNYKCHLLSNFYITARPCLKLNGETHWVRGAPNKVKTYCSKVAYLSLNRKQKRVFKENLRWHHSEVQQMFQRLQMPGKKKIDLKMNPNDGCYVIKSSCLGCWAFKMQSLGLCGVTNCQFTSISSQKRSSSCWMSGCSSTEPPPSRIPNRKFIRTSSTR